MHLHASTIDNCYSMNLPAVGVHSIHITPAQNLYPVIMAPVEGFND